MELELFGKVSRLVVGYFKSLVEPLFWILLNRLWELVNQILWDKFDWLTDFGISQSNLV